MLKKCIVLVLAVAIQVGFVSCSENGLKSEDQPSVTSLKLTGMTESQKMDLRLVAWQYLEDKSWTSSVTHSYEEAQLDESSWGEIATIVVTFRTINDSLLGPFRVHVDPVSMQVVGVAPRL